MNKSRTLTIASTAIFLVVTALMIFYWPPVEKYKEISESSHGCFLLNKDVKAVVNLNHLSIKSQRNSIRANAEEGVGKSGHYISSNPGIIIKRTGEVYSFKLTESAIFFWIKNSDELYTYSEDGEILKLLRTKC